MANIHDYYRKNFLYEGHKMMLPELRDKVAQTCAHCKFFVLVTGGNETRNGCAAQIPRYAGLSRRVPGELDAVEVLELVGREGLERVLSTAGPHRQACWQFHPRG
ncbi:hypothetical protein Psch_00662 [Pelotomaculum schinkii]|uniref:Uncharacterized protein n=1 Tax=Pelotomaculum schinkii TaxID=78350 RepID=A0A4Y7REA5_9FIRM|nr:hypothetical protein [Pelotomaculum schinkii]TEB07119.1 hypothetical protein Psch_00662 [Pelotomaculum schinkii]